MNDPFITIVHNADNGFCRLLIIYDKNQYYYSDHESYKNLRNFKNPSLIELNDDKIVIYDRIGKHSISLSKFV